MVLVRAIRTDSVKIVDIYEKMCYYMCIGF